MNRLSFTTASQSNTEPFARGSSSSETPAATSETQDTEGETMRRGSVHAPAHAPKPSRHSFGG